MYINSNFLHNLLLILKILRYLHYKMLKYKIKVNLNSN